MKKIFLIAVLIILISNISYALSEDRVVKLFEQIIIETNWYEGEHSHFAKLIDVPFEYELYKKTFEDKKIMGEVGIYYFLCKEKTGVINTIPLIQISEFGSGPTKEYGLSLFPSVAHAQNSWQLNDATFLKKGTLHIAALKPNYGPISRKEIEAGKEIVNLIKEWGEEYYGLSKGTYTLYVQRFSIEDSLVPIVLVTPSGQEYYMYVGNLLPYTNDFLLDLDIQFNVPKYDVDFYLIDQIKRDQNKFTFRL